MIKVLIYYNFILIWVMTLGGFLGAKSGTQLLSAILFFPLAVYFTKLVLPKRKRAIVIPEILSPPARKKTKLTRLAAANPVQEKTPSTTPTESPVVLEKAENGFDLDRRMFLKLIGSAGLTVFFFSIFTRKAEAAFFGGGGGQGAIKLKDSSGTFIDPAVKQPTDGYKISEVDDSSPGYYGFVDKNGNWFIMKEENNGYRYVKKTDSTSFADAWESRSGLTYGYFDAIF